jgi:hypothetical protein
MASAGKLRVMSQVEGARDADLAAEIRAAAENLCAKMNEARVRSIAVNFNIGQSAPDLDFSVTRLEILKKL